MIIILLLMKKTYKEVIYNKSSSQGKGPIPIGAKGKVLLFVDHPVTKKLLVDFSPYGKAIVPLSSIKKVEEVND